MGKVTFYLWLGRTTDYNNGKKFDPQEHDLLPDTDNDLKQFIYRLLGFDAPFKDAETARRALLELSSDQINNNIQRSGDLVETKKRFPIYRVLLGMLALLLLGGGIWYYFWCRSKSTENRNIAWNKLLRNFSEVSNVTSGKFFLYR